MRRQSCGRKPHSSLDQIPSTGDQANSTWPSLRRAVHAANSINVGISGTGAGGIARIKAIESLRYPKSEGQRGRNQVWSHEQAGMT